MYIPHFAYLVIHHWTHGLLPNFVCCKSFCYEHKCANNSSRPCLPFFECMCRNGTAGSYSNSIFHLLRNCHTVFHSSYSSVHSHQQCTISQHSYQHLLFSFFFFFIVSILIDVAWYLVTVLHFSNYQ